jgi:hypothetical protein
MARLGEVYALQIWIGVKFTKPFTATLGSAGRYC